MDATDPLDPTLRIDIFGGPHQPTFLAAGAALTSGVLLAVFGIGSVLVALAVLGFATMSLYVLARMELEFAARRSRRSLAERAKQLNERRRARALDAARERHPANIAA